MSDIYLADETDILYNLITYVNTSYTQDIYYQISYIILQNIEKIPNISINELADLCFTSPATISRFCKAIQCDNFNKFKKQVERGLEAASKEIRLVPEDLMDIHKDANKCKDLVYDLVIDSLIACKESINMHDVDNLCDLIYDSERLHLFGFQFNKIIASDFQLKMLKLGKFAYAFSDRGNDDQRVEVVDDTSLAIVFSVRARSKTIDPLIDKIKSRGAKVVLITLNPEPTSRELCDKVIVLKGQESDFTDSSTSGTTIIKTFLDLVYLRFGILYHWRTY